MKNPFPIKIGQLIPSIGQKTHKKIEKEDFHFSSSALNRDVRVEIFLPPGYSILKSYPALFINDGQDLKAMGLEKTLLQLYSNNRIRNLLVVGLYAQDRMQEYGTAGIPDYRKRGSKAGAYNQFVIRELLPYLEKNYRLQKRGQHAFAGFSLGGLSAFDIVWSHSRIFSMAGVFSGSFWWRSHAVKPEDPDADRIMHHILQKSRKRDGLRFWLQTGTDDEKEDRNNNGVIDSIDDTLDIISELEQLGYHRGKDIKYVEVLHGQHNQETWAQVMPDFLQWAFGK